MRQLNAMESVMVERDKQQQMVRSNCQWLLGKLSSAAIIHGHSSVAAVLRF